MAFWQASGTLVGALTTSDVTPTLPAHQNGDALFLLTSNRVTTNTCATPAGWTLLAGPIDTTNWRSYCFFLAAASSSETNPLCDWTATSADKYAQVHNIRGAGGAADTFGSGADLTDPITFTGVTTSVAGCYVAVMGIGSDNASASVTVTATDPASFTQRDFQTITTGADATGSFHDATQTAAGATGTITLDHNSTMPAEYVFVVAFPPPAAGDPFPYVGGGYYPAEG